MSGKTTVQAQEASADEIVNENIANPSKRAEPGRLKHFEVKQAEKEAEEAKLLPTVSEMAGGDGSPISRVHDVTGKVVDFYARSPKLRALDQMQQTIEQMQAGNLNNVAAVMQISTYFLVVEVEDKTRRAATLDEIADCFDVGDVQLLSQLAAKYLNLKLQTGAPSPNA